MLIEIEDLKNSPEKQVVVDFNEYLAELGNSEDVIGKITVKLMPYGVNIKGNLKTEIDLCCDRCLSSFNYKINTHMNEDFLFDSLVQEGIKEIELHPGDLVNELTDKAVIDLTDIVYQTMILELPTQSLCSENCKGINKDSNLKLEEENNPQLDKLKNYFNK